MSDNTETDIEFLKRNSIKTFYPPNECTIKALEEVEFQSCDEHGPVRDELLLDFKRYDLDDHIFRTEVNKGYVYVSLQSLVPIFSELGYDIRPGMPDFAFEQVEAMLKDVDARATLPKPALAGAIEVNGRMGFLATREWLQSAGIEPRIASSWQSSILSNLADFKAPIRPKR